MGLSIIEQLRAKALQALPTAGTAVVEAPMSIREQLLKKVAKSLEAKKRKVEREKQFGPRPVVCFWDEVVRKEFYQACSGYKARGFVEYGGLEFPAPYVEYLFRWLSGVYGDVPRSLHSPRQIESTDRLPEPEAGETGDEGTDFMPTGTLVTSEAGE